MDQETLTNHISKLGKHYFDNACKIVLKDVFNLHPINVDGKNNGGTDISAYNIFGESLRVAYQITTQKTDIKNKAYKDAAKAIKKLDVNRFYFLTTYILDETEARKIENDITKELKIQSYCLSSKHIAGLILSENLLNKFLDESNYPLPHMASSTLTDYREMALHMYTLMSGDAISLKGGIYDDSILFVLSNNEPLNQNDLIQKVIEFLGISETKEDELQRRIGALFGKEKLKRTEEGLITLNENSRANIEARKKVYEIELSNLVSAQVDLLRNEYQTDWTIEDSKKVAIWIANTFINEQISNLKDAKASIVSNSIFQLVDGGLDNIKSFLKKDKSIDSEHIDELVGKLLKLASNHPLITKITRASIYLALEGADPVSSAKALGASRWSDFKILIEPTVAIPYTCSQLYLGQVNRYFDMSIKSIRRAKKLGASLYIPFFYINECAGHLLQARKYKDLELDENELQYSTNAFVANYYALKLRKARVPANLMEYLCTFSTAIKTERSDVKEWVRSIMTDIQSILNRASIDFVEVPFYTHEDCSEFEREYAFYLTESQIDKPGHLINHDVYALQFTNDRITKEYEHWIILTYDKSLIHFSKSEKYKGWINNPIKFLDMTEVTRPLSETHFISLVHSVATYSEKTLSAGARIIDRIIQYASTEMQNWQFKKDIEKFKKELISNIDLDTPELNLEIDKKTDEFLESRGIKLKIKEEEEIDI
ncbi:MAG: hypothetical protein ACTSQ8_24195 [Candidatus Helarchaeota archaeon]